MQIKTTMRYHSPLLEWPKLKKTDNTKCWWKCRTTLLHRWWEPEMRDSLWKTLQQCLVKINAHQLYDTVIPLLGIYLREMKTAVTKRWIQECLFIVVPQCKQCKWSSKVDKQFMTHVLLRMNLKGIM